MKNNRNSVVTLKQYLDGADQLAEKYIAWLKEQKVMMTPEQIARASSVPVSRIALAIKMTERDPRIKVTRSAGVTYYRAS
jgi:hypothetical protein